MVRRPYSLVSVVPIITGHGLVTPLGDSAATTWESLLGGRFITDHSKVNLEPPAGISRVSNLAIRAAREAVRDVSASSLRDAAIVVGTSKGPVEDWLGARESEAPAEPGFGLAQVATDVARECQIFGPRLTISTACASGLHALIRGAMMIRAGEAKRVLVVAAEASVHPLFIASFDRLGIIPSAGFGCRPFDRDRQGFVMSEAAAAVWIEASPPENMSGVVVERFAMSADATHLTRTSADAQPLQGALGQVWANDQVDLVHAHGTGTVHNDVMELAVLERLSNTPAVAPNVYSHKGALGHSLGAAGLVSVVLNVMAHRTGIVPGNVRTGNPIATVNLRISSEAVRRSVRRSIAVAAGFGGQIAAVSLTSQLRPSVSR